MSNVLIIKANIHNDEKLLLFTDSSENVIQFAKPHYLSYFWTFLTHYKNREGKQRKCVKYLISGGFLMSREQIPAYSVKQIVRGDLRIFSSKRSFLLRKRMIEVSPNHLLLQIESNSFRLSCILLVVSSSCNT